MTNINLNILAAEELPEEIRFAVVRFKQYYKFTFWFYGETADGKRIDVAVGGDSSDIYRLEVNADEPIFVGTIFPLINTITVIDNNIVTKYTIER
jgi:hypothetical protein